jgi:hypothetical protein
LSLFATIAERPRNRLIPARYHEPLRVQRRDPDPDRPGRAGAGIGATIGPDPGGPSGWYRLRLDIDGRQLSFLISPGGDIRAG